VHALRELRAAAEPPPDLFVGHTFGDETTDPSLERTQALVRDHRGNCSARAFAVDRPLDQRSP
jgi:hypothetical protein